MKQTDATYLAYASRTASEMPAAHSRFGRTNARRFDASRELKDVTLISAHAYINSGNSGNSAGNDAVAIKAVGFCAGRFDDAGFDDKGGFDPQPLLSSALSQSCLSLHFRDRNAPPSSNLPVNSTLYAYQAMCNYSDKDSSNIPDVTKAIGTRVRGNPTHGELPAPSKPLIIGSYA